ncbi:hypothetical protein [Neobacillus vireti]|uniref:DUF4355 domain-containing protein n=1 Tax=Neobacillus vireti LMG 21834 TaxID=1131730 RepID=A0AB94IM92_9BACI|nr:hypothetical protein [Neobacillus vireti]ETI68130.1 hypothetical protein BAVI_14044 [Neobacillus vireti LMG 21834]KLT15911.1 hypothetical protein AA980_22215 [Neobacillus vireti]
MSEVTFTQEQLLEEITKAKNEWLEKEYNPIVQERDGLLQYKPKELSDEEKAIQTKQEELWKKEVSLSLKENGLEQFASIINISNEDELKVVVNSLTQIVNDIKVATGYVPSNHKNQNEYDVFASKGDTKGMIATKLSKLFG